MREISVLEVLYGLTIIVSVRECGGRSPSRPSLIVDFTMLLTQLELLLCSVPDRRLELPTVVFDHDTRLHHETGARQQEHLALVWVSRERSDVDPNAVDFEHSGLSRVTKERLGQRFIL